MYVYDTTNICTNVFDIYNKIYKSLSHIKTVNKLSRQI